MLQVYQLRVTTRSLLANATRTLAAREPPVDFATGLPPFSPTWAALRLYFEAMFAEAGLQLPDEALELLQNSSFAELTNCPGVCTYVPADFPSKNQARRGRAGRWAVCWFSVAAQGSLCAGQLRLGKQWRAEPRQTLCGPATPHAACRRYRLWLGGRRQMAPAHLRRLAPCPPSPTLLTKPASCATQIGSRRW